METLRAGACAEKHFIENILNSNKRKRETCPEDAPPENVKREKLDDQELGLQETECVHVQNNCAENVIVENAGGSLSSTEHLLTTENDNTTGGVTNPAIATSRTSDQVNFPLNQPFPLNNSANAVLLPVTSQVADVYIESARNKIKDATLAWRSMESYKKWHFSYQVLSAHFLHYRNHAEIIHEKFLNGIIEKSGDADGEVAESDGEDEVELNESDGGEEDDNEEYSNGEEENSDGEDEVELNESDGGEEDDDNEEYSNGEEENSDGEEDDVMVNENDNEMEENDNRSLPEIFQAEHREMEQFLLFLNPYGPHLPNLHDVLFAGDVAKAKALIAAGEENVNAKDYQGRTPLHICMWLEGDDFFQITSQLVLYSADINATNHLGKTLLHLAAESGKTRADLEHLIGLGADPNATDAAGDTIIHYLARQGDVESLNFFISSLEVDANKRNNSNNTPMHAAAISCWRNFKETVDVLFDGGCSVNEPGARGYSAWRFTSLFDNDRTCCDISHMTDVSGIGRLTSED